MTIVPFLEGRAFRLRDIQAMSTALEEVCKTLNLARRSQTRKRLFRQDDHRPAQRATAPCSCVIASSRSYLRRRSVGGWFAPTANSRIWGEYETTGWRSR